MHHILDWALIALFAPLVAAVITGFSSSALKTCQMYWTCCSLVGLSCLISIACLSGLHRRCADCKREPLHLGGY